MYEIKIKIKMIFPKQIGKGEIIFIKDNYSSYLNSVP